MPTTIPEIGYYIQYEFRKCAGLFKVIEVDNWQIVCLQDANARLASCSSSAGPSYISYCTNITVLQRCHKLMIYYG